MSNEAQHVTVEELADADEQLLPPARAQSVSAHLESCDDCQELAAALARSCAALADEPAPPMPDDVLARLQAVVAAESARRSAGADDDAEAAALAAKRTSLGTFGQNPAYDKLRAAPRRATPQG